MTGIIAQVLSFPCSSHPKFFDQLSDKYELASYQQNHDAPVVTVSKMELFWDVYEPDPKPDPYHSPLLGDLKGLPPARKFWRLPSPAGRCVLTYHSLRSPPSRGTGPVA